MPPPPPDVTVERPTTEEALAEVSARLGPGAEIVSAQKVARGGIRGFFAREMVQIVARPPVAEFPPRPGVAGVLDRLASAADEEEALFQDVLRRELAAELLDRAVGSLPAASPPAPGMLAFDPRPPPGMGRPAWDVDVLARLGVPDQLTAAVAGVHPADDVAWVRSLAAAAGDLLGPLAEGPTLYAGPAAGALGAVLGLDHAAYPDSPVTAASWAATVESSPAEADWLARARGDRALHLVLGGGPWRELLIDTPAAVSWATDAGVVDALRVAAATGCPVAFGTTGGLPAQFVRAGPLDVALAIRRLVART